MIFDNTWRVSGGLRYEDFKQVSLATSSLIFDEQDLNNYFNPQRVVDSSISEDDVYTALSLTYMANDNYQLRFGYGETVVRPDLRETVPVAYYDPVTDIRTGTFGLKALTKTTTLVSSTMRIMATTTRLRRFIRIFRTL